MAELNVKKVVFADLGEIPEELLDKMKDYYLSYVRGYYEMNTQDIRNFEDDLYQTLTCTEDEYPVSPLTAEDKEQLMDSLGHDVYEALLNEEIDYIFLCYE